jgi:hypothetical protein
MSGKILTKTTSGKNQVLTNRQPDPYAGSILGRYGLRTWKMDGQLHRLDGPAWVAPDGGKRWYFEGEKHRTDGPAITKPDGTLEWWVEGKIHRDDGPAIERAIGRVEWWLNDHPLVGPDYEELVFKLAAEQFGEGELTSYPFSQIESLLYIFNNWVKEG